FAMFFLAEYASMVTVACLSVVLFFGGWLSPFPATAAFAWTRYIPAAVLGGAGIAVIVTGVRYYSLVGRIAMPVLGLILCAVAMLTTRPGVIDVVQGPFWFLLKIVAVLFVYVWIRWTLPRFRYDQLMRIGWKVLLPLSLANVVLTSLAV